MQAIELSDKHQAFAYHLANGDSIEKAGKKAGFSTPTRDAMPAVMRADMQRFARARVQGKLILSGAPQAYEFLVRTMNDTRVDLKLRVHIALQLFAAAGHTPPKAADAGEKDPGDVRQMTREQLRDFIAQGERELAERAKPAMLEGDVVVITAPQTIDDLI